MRLDVGEHYRLCKRNAHQFLEREVLSANHNFIPEHSQRYPVLDALFTTSSPSPKRIPVSYDPSIQARSSRRCLCKRFVGTSVQQREDVYTLALQ